SADENKGYNTYRNHAHYFNCMFSDSPSNRPGTYHLTNTGCFNDWLFFKFQTSCACHYLIFNYGIGWFTYFFCFFRRSSIYFDAFIWFYPWLYPLFLHSRKVFREIFSFRNKTSHYFWNVELFNHIYYWFNLYGCDFKFIYE